MFSFSTYITWKVIANYLRTSKLAVCLLLVWTPSCEKACCTASTLPNLLGRQPDLQTEIIPFYLLFRDDVQNARLKSLPSIWSKKSGKLVVELLLPDMQKEEENFLKVWKHKRKKKSVHFFKIILAMKCRVRTEQYSF